MHKFFFYNFVILLLTAVFGTTSADLQLVQVVARHGLRSPAFAYPNDPFSNATRYWPNGWDELTELGKSQQVDLGIFLRTRYSKFLPEKYSKDLIHALSSGYDRTILSAQLALYGMFNQKYQDEEKYSEFLPVHSIPRKLDKMIQPNPQCPLQKVLYEEAMRSNPIMQKYYKDNEELFAGIRRNMGYPSEVINEMFNSVGSLMIQKLYNMSIPIWAEDLLSSKSQMKQIYKGFQLLTVTDELKRLRGGPLLVSIIQNMDNKIKQLEKRNFFYYSGHDILLGNLLNTMGVWTDHWPGFSACLIFELHFNNITKEKTVEIYYKKYANLDELSVISVHGCSNPCALNSFTKILHKYLPENLDKECSIIDTGIATAWYNSKINTIITGTTLGFVVCVFITQIIMIWVSERYKSLSLTGDKAN